MRSRVLWGYLIIVLAAGALSAQITGDVIGVHNLGGANSPITGTRTDSCMYCHAPHSGTGNVATVESEALDRDLHSVRQLHLR